MSRSHSPSKKKHKKSKKHKRDSSSDTSSGHEKKKKHKKHKKKKDSEKKHSKTKRESETQSKPAETSGEPLFEFQARRLKETSAALARLPAATPKAIVESNPEEKARVSGPMSKQDYDKVNSQIREVRDPKVDWSSSFGAWGRRNSGTNCEQRGAAKDPPFGNHLGWCYDVWCTQLIVWSPLFVFFSSSFSHIDTFSSLECSTTVFTRHQGG